MSMATTFDRVRHDILIDILATFTVSVWAACVLNFIHENNTAYGNFMLVDNTANVKCMLAYSTADVNFAFA